MAGTEEEVEPECIDSKVEALAEALDKVHTKLDRVLAILDSKEHKKLKDRIRIKQKRDEENAAQAHAAGKIVVDRLQGTLHTDPRLPYKLWAYIIVLALNEYLKSYYCIRDSRRRMIVRKGNHWKYYAKGCGTEVLVPPAKMFGGQQLHGQSMLELTCLRWCHVHVRPIIEHVCNLDRLMHVHEKRMAWNDPRVDDEIGAKPLPLEDRWWRKKVRFREIMHATLGVYGEGWIRTTKGSMLIDFDESCLGRREVQVVYTDIAHALHDGVNNRASHAKWVEMCRLQKFIDRGTETHKNSLKEIAHRRFIQSLHAHRDQNHRDVRHKVMAFAAAAKEEHDMQKAIEASLSTGSTESNHADDEKTDEPAPTDVPPPTPGK